MSSNEGKDEGVPVMSVDAALLLAEHFIVDSNHCTYCTVFTGLGTVIRNTISDEFIMHQYSLAIVISKSNSEEG